MNERRIKSVGVPSAEGAPADAAPQPDLAQLLRCCAKGDEGAFAEFYDATSSRSWGLALRVVRNPAQAQEVMQEAYLQAWRQSARFDRARGSATAWLLTIVHRSAVDRVRSAEASHRRDQTFFDQSPDTTEHDATADAAQVSLDARRVKDAMIALTSLQREAVTLAYFGGYTHTEVAGMLDIPVGTAKTRIRDGLIRLRDTLGVEA
ncbi:MAG: ECF RNA polymerase sigma factor SigK [Aeromicrobium sp.]